jgi:hypothetical protein
MNSPVTEKTGAGFSMFWPDSDILFEFENFSETRAWGPVCELGVTVGVNGHAIRIEQARVKLASVSDRGQWSKRLQEVHPHLPWKEIIQNSFIRVQSERRKGEPAVRLSKAAKGPAASYRISPLSHDELPTTIFCEAGSAKSYLALLCCMLVESGEAVCGLSAIKGRALFLDWEMSEKAHGERWRLLCAGHPELADSDPLYKRMYAPLPDDLQAVQGLVTTHDIQFVVVDSLGPAAGQELLGAETAIKFFQAVRTLKTAVLVIGHTAKNSETKSIFGSVFFFNLSRNVFELKKAQESQEDVLRVGLHHRKSNLTKLHRPFGLELTFAPEQVKFSSFDLGTDAELAKDLPLKDRMVKALEQGAMTARDLADQLDAQLGQVKVRLSQKKGSLFIQMGQDKWGLLRKF